MTQWHIPDRLLELWVDVFFGHYVFTDSSLESCQVPLGDAVLQVSSWSGHHIAEKIKIRGVFPGSKGGCGSFVEGRFFGMECAGVFLFLYTCQGLHIAKFGLSV